MGQTRLGWSFLPLMEGGGGEVCRHVTKHSVYIIGPS